MSILDKILGRSIASGANKKQQLTAITGVPTLGLDAFASSAYGPEAALMILLPLGFVGFQYFFMITIMVIVTLILLYLSYFQTVAAYPNGAGAYIVASDNLGKRTGLWAAVALLLDYLLNVAVGISAGVGAVVSAIPLLQPYILEFCLFALLMLTIINLRGIRASALVFIVPTLVFVACIGTTIVIGLIRTGAGNGHPIPVVTPSLIHAENMNISIWLFLGAFANGLTAMTGVEAVSNAIPLFRKPTVRNAQWTLSIIIGVLALFLLGIGFLCPSYQIGAMDETQFGYKTILSQLVAAVFGKGIFYYISIASIFIVLTYSAQTSFIDFPRVCRLLAEDNYLPHFFADKGRRLVYSVGIIILSLLAALILIVFKGITYELIPLFAIGAFTAFFLSQTGMVIYWLRNKNQKNYLKLTFNALGATITFIALVVIIIEKFSKGAWIVILVALPLVCLCTIIKRHYNKVTRQIDHPLELHNRKLKKPVVIIPIYGLDVVAEKAIQIGLLLSDDVTVVNISTEKDVTKNPLKKLWMETVKIPSKNTHLATPHFEIIYSPYRYIYKPILDFVKQVKKKKPDGLIAVIIPELVEPHWYEYLLHNLGAASLRMLLFFEKDRRTIIITIPWYLH